MRLSHRLGASGPRAAFALAFAAVLAAAAPLAAQNGRIGGRVVNAQGEPVPAAQVAVTGTTLRASTDVQGRYTLSGVPAGTHSVTATALSYSSKTVTGVSVTAGELTALNLSLSPTALLLGEVTVTAQAETGSTRALLSERRNSATVVDALGADQIAQSPDDDAAAATRRVPGVTVVDGKYVYVRGLGERYGNTTLNGATLPSPIPDKKAVPLDVIPASLLESVVTAKTYSPDQPGDYAGGLVQLETRNAPSEPLLRLSTGLGLVSGVSGQPGLDAPIPGRFGMLGFSDQSLPAEVSRDAEFRGIPSTPGVRESIAADLADTGWEADRLDIPVNRSFGLAFGNEFGVLGRQLGVLGTVTYSNSMGQPENRYERFFAVSGDAPETQTDFRSQATERETTVGALVNTSLRLSDTDRLTATLVYNHLAETEARLLQGPYATLDVNLVQNRVQHVENTLASSQLRGEHFFAGLNDLNLKWRVARSQGRRYEPGTRTTLYQDLPGGPVYLFNRVESGLILHQDLEDDSWNPGVDLKMPVGFLGSSSTLGLGGAADLRDRTVYTRRLGLRPVGTPSEEVLRMSPGDIFTEDRIGTQPGQFNLVENTFAGDNYDGEYRVYAGYAMLDAEIIPRLRLSGGARVEAAQIDVAQRNQLNRAEAALPAASLDNVDILPGVNLTYELTPNVNLRAAVSRTVARPQFRELAPYPYADYFGGQLVVGNPTLERTSILNGDLRWEWFMGSGSVVSASAFYKRFDNPIEPLALTIGTNAGLTFANGDRAELYGTELEMRTNLGRLVPALEAFSVNTNLTLVHSSVNVGNVTILNPSATEPTVIAASSASRPLFGQSPYVINAGLTYDRAAWGTTATVLFNRFGRRLDAFGGETLPDIYEEGRTQLDLTLEQDLPRGLGLKFSASRLLGQDVKFTQSFPNGDTVTTREYELGRSFSLSLSWERGN